MIIFTILEDLERRGLMLGANGEKVRCTPRELLTDADRQAIHENRAALISILRLRAFANALNRGEIPPNGITGRRLRHLHAGAEKATGQMLTLEGVPLVPKSRRAALTPSLVSAKPVSPSKNGTQGDNEQ